MLEEFWDNWSAADYDSKVDFSSARGKNEWSQ